MRCRLFLEQTQSFTKFDPVAYLSSDTSNRSRTGGLIMAAETKATDALDKFLMKMWRLQLPEGESAYIRQLNYRQVLVMWEVCKAYKMGLRQITFQDLIIKYSIPDYSLTKDTQSLREGKVSYRTFSAKNLNKGAGWIIINRDGRNKLIALTTKGKALCDEIWKTIS
jgi:hypothetical protein